MAAATVFSASSSVTSSHQIQADRQRYSLLLHLAALSTVASSSSRGVVFATAHRLRSSRLDFRLLSFDLNNFWSLYVTGGFFRRCLDFENFDFQITAGYKSGTCEYTRIYHWKLSEINSSLHGESRIPEKNNLTTYEKLSYMLHFTPYLRKLWPPPPSLR